MTAHQLKVMVSSTSLDLPEHRKHVIDAVLRAGCMPLAMEYESATPDGNAIVYSRNMVAQADVYIGVFAYRYGTIVEDPKSNPQRWSVTEHEYRHAAELEKDILIYFIHDDHPVKGSDVDTEPERVDKLRKLRSELAAEHVGAFFESPDNLEFLVLDSLYKLGGGGGDKTIHVLPSPPSLYAVPPYTLTDEFVGRQAELDQLDGWACSSQTVMVYEAIGGMGKSALTWEWTRKHAQKQIPGFAGSLWWSFYDTASSMRGLLRTALAYIRQQDPEELRTVADWEAAQALIGELNKSPYLLVLDGFERILAAYHQVEKAQIPDDKIEDLRQCILPTDADLIRYLVDCGCSKILISTRLMPRALESIPGVAHLKLEGLDPKDAESLARGKGMRGTSRRIQEFAGQFEYHPLVLRVVCGVVNDPPYRGDFDKWLDDPAGGGKLEFGTLELRQRKTHILAFALAGLEPLQRQLLSRISVLSDNADYETIKVLSPFGSDAEFYAALKNLEGRGLIQWESTTNTYDLHPVVRASAHQLLEEQDRKPTYDTLQNYFSALPPENLEAATELGHLKNGVEVFRLLVGGGHLKQAASHYRGSLSNALLFSVGAYGSICGLLRELLKRAGDEPVKALGTWEWGYVANSLSLALWNLGEEKAARTLLTETIRINLTARNWGAVASGIGNFAQDQRPLLQQRAYELDLELSEVSNNSSRVAKASLELAVAHAYIGNYTEAQRFLERFRSWPLPPRAMYRPGYAERVEAEISFRSETRIRRLLDSADAATRMANTVEGQRLLAILRSRWEFTEGNLTASLAAADDAIVISRRTGAPDSAALALRAGALAGLGRAKEAREALDAASRGLSLHYCVHATEAYVALGEFDHARDLVRTAYRIAWADGPPYCYLWELERCRELMKALAVPELQLSPFDPASVEKLPYEDEIRAAIEMLRAETAKSRGW